MKKFKKSIMALAAFCAITANANAYTLNLSTRWPSKNLEFTVTFKANFPPYPFGEKETEETEGDCTFCYGSPGITETKCWDYKYSWDGKKTIYIENVGIVTIFKNSVGISNFNMNFEVVK